MSERLKKKREDRERRRQARREKKERRKQKKLERLQKAREAAAQANVLSLIDLQKFVEISENEYTKVGYQKRLPSKFTTKQEARAIIDKLPDTNNVDALMQLNAESESARCQSMLVEKGTMGVVSMRALSKGEPVAEFRCVLSLSSVFDENSAF